MSAPRCAVWFLAIFAVLTPTVAAAQGQVTRERDELAGGIAGRACQDLDADGRCSADEPGHAGLRLVLETGQQVVTDAQGRYHLAAVPSRTPEARGGLRLLPGRHRLRADARRLAPGARVVPEAVTLEVPLAGLVLQDFAVQRPMQEVARLRQSPQEAPPEGGPQPQAQDGVVLHELSGQVAPGARVEVAAEAAEAAAVVAEVTADGRYVAQVPVRPGPNVLTLRVEAPGGQVQLYSQRVDVVRRRGGVLVVPRAPRPLATVEVPATREAPAAAGPGAVVIEGAPGTVIQSGERTVTVGESGRADLPVTLVPGDNAVDLTVAPPGEPATRTTLLLPARAQPFAVALLDLEVSFGLGAGDLSTAARVTGRGAAHAEVALGQVLVEGQLDLRDTDLLDAREAGAFALAFPRRPEAFDRALDPDRHPHVWGDESTTLVPNPGESRLRLSATHPDHGTVGFGNFRASFMDAEVGRYHRGLTGPYARVHTREEAKVGAEVRAFASPGMADPAAGLATVPAHAEFLATGGSLFYLPHGSVVRGSDQVRVVLRDGVTAVPIGERHLVRGVDYELDPLSGRLLLARPLSLVAGLPLLSSDLPQAGAAPLLVVDYERLVFGESLGAAGAEVGARLGPLRARVGAVQEGAFDGGFWLLRGAAEGKLGPLRLSVEAAQSQGHAHRAGDVTLSESGGLDFVGPTRVQGDLEGAAPEGWALTTRLHGPTYRGGRVDLSWRRRTRGYSDATWDGRGALAQLSGQVEQPVGPLRVGLLGDARTAVDPRAPFGDREIAQRTLGGYVGWFGKRFELRLAGRDASLDTDARAEGPDEEGARSSVGLAARYRVHERLWLVAAHRHNLAVRGAGPGAYDDTFSQVGADVAWSEGARYGLRAGWGPALGALAWAHAEVARGEEVFYGSYSVDVDGPDVGERRAVSGARTHVAEGTTVFVEDVGAHNATDVRIARAVGLSHALGSGLELTGRYERGVRHPLEFVSGLRRDAGGAGLSWVRARVRLSGRAEVRRERGRRLLTASLPEDEAALPNVDRWQRLVTAAASFDLMKNLRLAGRVNASDTRRSDSLEALLVESSVGLSWRPGPLLLVAQWAQERERRADRPLDVALRRLSVMPSVRLGDRFAVASGAHVGWSSVGASRATVVSASLRPSVRVVGGLELAAEVARRSAAPDGGELTAVRSEAGYRFGDALMMAVGYNVFGFEGLGLSPVREEAQRVYLRAEAAW